MQLATDTDLAAYLALDSRNLKVSVLVDWNNDNYQSAYSDVSSLWDEIIIERNYQGNIPDELKLVEGYSIAQMSVKFSGRRRQDSLSLRDLLGPWNPDSPFYGGSKLSCAIKCYVTVPLNPTRVLNQFVGVIREVTIGQDLDVVITALDLMYKLTSSVTMKPTAVDYFTAITTVNTIEQQSWNSVWAIDQILRRVNLYNSPAPLQASSALTPYFCVTLNGSWNPESNGNAIITSPLTIITSPDAKYIAGKYGYAANGTATKRSRYLYQVVPNAVAIAVSWAKGEAQQCGGWVFGPQTCVGSTTIICDVTLSGDPDLAGLCAFELYLSSAGVVSARLRQLTGQTYNVTFTGPTIAGPAAWHYIGVAFEWRVSNSGVTATFNVDGSITTSVNATVLLAYTAFQYYSSVRVESNMPTQHVQWWKTNTPGALTWPKDPPTTPGGLNPQTRLGLGLLSQTKIPEVYAQKGLDTIAAVVGAEVGVIYANEDGLVEFLNRADVVTARIPANNFNLPLADLKRLKVHDRDDPFRNRITATATTDVLLGDNIYASDRLELFDTPAATNKIFLVPVEGIQRVTPTTVPYVTPWPADPSGITSGFFAIKSTDGTAAVGVTVAAFLADSRTLLVYVGNAGATGIRLGAVGGAPALRIGGYWLYEFTESTLQYTDSASITALGRDQVEPLGKEEWRSHPTTLGIVASSILADVAYPIPLIDPVEVRGDPRRQLNDTATVTVKGIGIIQTAVIGITRKFKRDEPITDTLVLQATNRPGT